MNPMSQRRRNRFLSMGKRKSSSWLPKVSQNNKRSFKHMNRSCSIMSRQDRILQLQLILFLKWLKDYSKIYCLIISKNKSSGRWFLWPSMSSEWWNRLNIPSKSALTAAWFIRSVIIYGCGEMWSGCRMIKTNFYWQRTYWRALKALFDKWSLHRKSVRASTKSIGYRVNQYGSHYLYTLYQRYGVYQRFIASEKYHRGSWLRNCQQHCECSESFVEWIGFQSFDMPLDVTPKQIAERVTAYIQKMMYLMD